MRARISLAVVASLITPVSRGTCDLAGSCGKRDNPLSSPAPGKRREMSAQGEEANSPNVDSKLARDRDQRERDRAHGPRIADGGGIKLRAYLRAAIDGNGAALAVIKHQMAKFPDRATTGSSVLAV